MVEAIRFPSYCLARWRLIFLFTYTGLWVGQKREGGIISTEYIPICCFPLAGVTKTARIWSTEFNAWKTCFSKLVILQPPFLQFVEQDSDGLWRQSPWPSNGTHGLGKGWNFSSICFDSTTVRGHCQIRHQLMCCRVMVSSSLSMNYRMYILPKRRPSFSTNTTNDTNSLLPKTKPFHCWAEKFNS